MSGADYSLASAAIIAAESVILEAWKTRWHSDEWLKDIAFPANARQLVLILAEAIERSQPVDEVVDPVVASELSIVLNHSLRIGCVSRAVLHLRECITEIICGVLDNSSKVQVLERLSVLVAHCIENAASRRLTDLETEATRDQLTGLFNERAYQRDVLRLWRRGAGLALAIIDMNGLKKINDCQGHDAGDLAIKRLGVAVLHAVGDLGTLYRLHGDEFAVMCEKVHADKLSSALKTLQMTCLAPFSWGVEVNRESDTSPGAVQRAADAKMYEMKKATKGRSVSSIVSNMWHWMLQTLRCFRGTYQVK